MKVASEAAAAATVVALLLLVQMVRDLPEHTLTDLPEHTLIDLQGQLATDLPELKVRRTSRVAIESLTTLSARKVLLVKSARLEKLAKKARRDNARSRIRTHGCISITMLRDQSTKELRSLLRLKFQLPSLRNNA